MCCTFSIIYLIFNKLQVLFIQKYLNAVLVQYAYNCSWKLYEKVIFYKVASASLSLQHLFRHATFCFMMLKRVVLILTNTLFLDGGKCSTKTSRMLCVTHYINLFIYRQNSSQTYSKDVRRGRVLSLPRHGGVGGSLVEEAGGRVLSLPRHGGVGGSLVEEAESLENLRSEYIMRSRDESPNIVQLDVSQNRVSITRDTRNLEPRVSSSSFKLLSPWSTSSLRVQYEAISIQSSLSI